MKLEIFFEKFDRFADAPDAVAKMRELVLQLAVQGKLVERKRDDGDAAQLLAAISSERDTPATKLRTPEEPASADDNGYAFQIPPNWAWTQLGNIALQIQYGYTASADPSATDIRMLRITDIQNNRVDWPSVPGCQIEQGEAEKYLLSPNDILIARTGGTIGKSFIVPDAPVKSVFASYLIRVTPPRSMAARYLKTFLESPLYWTQLRKMSAGTGQPNVNGQALGRLEIPLPPLAEQKRIAAKVDELMALCDRLEAQQQEQEMQHAAIILASLERFARAPTPANLPFLFSQSYSIPPADLRESILTLAVQGKLVPQNPNDEPVEEMIRRIAAELPEKQSANPFLRKTEPFITDESEYDLPHGWSWIPLGHIGIWATGCGFPKQYQGATDGEFLFCKVSDMNLPGNEAEIHTTMNSIDADVMKKIRARANPAGTVIFPKIGGAIATHKRRLVIKPTIIDNNCSGIQPIGLTDDKWLLRFMQSLDLTKYQSGTSVPAVSQGSLDPIRVGLPPLAEQRRIVAKVDQLIALVDQLETQLATSQATGSNLIDVIVSELAAAA
jgi:type I restriction enzyme S subunit